MNIFSILADHGIGQQGTDDATATAADIVSGKTAYVVGGKVTGTNVRKQWASGTISFPGWNQNVTITGLAFIPKHIILTYDRGAGATPRYVSNVSFLNPIDSTTWRSIYSDSFVTASVPTKPTSTQFVITTGSSGNDTWSTLNWYALESFS